VYDTVVNAHGESAIEFFHGYTYSGHPLAAAAACATLDLYKKENLFARAKEIAPYFEQAMHSLKGAPHVIDVRNMGLVAGVELEPYAGKPSAKAYEVFTRCYQKGILVRYTGDILAFSPPLIIEKKEIDQLVNVLADVLKSVQ
jgi:beta-alanine--pyruvate transaminase